MVSVILCSVDVIESQVCFRFIQGVRPAFPESSLYIRISRRRWASTNDHNVCTAEVHVRLALASAADISCLEISSRTAQSRESWSIIVKVATLSIVFSFLS